MTAQRVVRRERAERDIDEAAAHYRAEGGSDLELRFIDALDAAIRQIAAHPAAGSLPYASELRSQDLRSWPVKRFPYLIFYVERADHVDVWRVLHGLIEQARRIGKHRTKKEAVTSALREYVRRRRQLEILDLIGQVPFADSYDYKPLRHRKARA